MSWSGRSRNCCLVDGQENATVIAKAKKENKDPVMSYSNNATNEYALVFHMIPSWLLWICIPFPFLINLVCRCSFLVHLLYPPFSVNFCLLEFCLISPYLSTGWLSLLPLPHFSFCMGLVLSQVHSTMLDGKGRGCPSSDHCSPFLPFTPQSSELQDGSWLSYNGACTHYSWPRPDFARRGWAA